MCPAGDPAALVRARSGIINPRSSAFKVAASCRRRPPPPHHALPLQHLLQQCMRPRLQLVCRRPPARVVLVPNRLVQQLRRREGGAGGSRWAAASVMRRGTHCAGAHTLRPLEVGRGVACGARSGIPTPALPPRLPVALLDASLEQRLPEVALIRLLVVGIRAVEAGGRAARKCRLPKVGAHPAGGTEQCAAPPSWPRWPHHQTGDQALSGKQHARRWAAPPSPKKGAPWGSRS